MPQIERNRRGPACFVFVSGLLHAALIGMAILIPMDVPGTVAEWPAIEVEIIAAAPKPAPTPFQFNPEPSSFADQAPAPDELRTETAGVEPPAPILKTETPPPQPAQLPSSELSRPAESSKVDTRQVETPLVQTQAPAPPEPAADEIIRPAATPPPDLTTTPAGILPKEILLKELTSNLPKQVKPPEERKPERVQVQPKLARQRTEPRPERDQQKHKAATNPPWSSSESSERAAVQRAATSSAAARSSYAAIISAAINARKFYPSAARDQGSSGPVGLAFSVDGSGRVTSVTVTRSSGNALLDNAAYQAVLAMQAPPPPGGSFIASISLRFSLR